MAASKDPAMNVRDRRTITPPLWAGPLLLAGACAVSDGSVGTTQGSLTNGTVVTSNNAPFSSAVKISAAATWCSGTKIGARRFLTASHCQFVLDSPGGVPRGLVSAVPGGATISVSTAVDGSGGVSLAVKRFYYHPNYSGGTQLHLNRDAAVIDVLNDSPSIPSLPVDTSTVAAGSMLTFSGYGCDEQFPGDRSGQGIKRQFQLPTLSFTQWRAIDPANQNPNTVFSLFNLFDGGPLGFPDASPVYLASCPGDSGGSVFINRSGAWRTTGIMSFGYYGSETPTEVISAATRVSDIATWINSGTPAPKLRAGSFTNHLTGHCLTGRGSTTSGSAVGQEPCDGRNGSNDTQFWTRVASPQNPNFQNFINGKSHLCLDLSGSQPVQRPCTGAFNQMWTVTANQIRSGAAQLNLGTLGVGNVNAAAIESGTRQLWVAGP